MGLIPLPLFATLDLVAQAPGGPEEDPEGFPLGGWQAPLIDEWSGTQIAEASDGSDPHSLWRRVRGSRRPMTAPTRCCWGAGPTTSSRRTGPTSARRRAAASGPCSTAAP